jgi:hypothetical protein
MTQPKSFNLVDTLAVAHLSISGVPLRPVSRRREMRHNSRDGSQIRTVWAGRALSGLAVILLVADSVGKLLEVAPVIEGTTQLGYHRDVVFTLGMILLACVLAYAIPRTSVIGALLLTGYLGGAVATHVRIESPLFTHILFPIYIAAIVWGGLFLRDARLRALLPLRSAS